MTKASENLSVLRTATSTVSLWRAGAAGGLPQDEDTPIPEGTVLAVPAEQVRLTEVTVSSAEVRHLQQSLPFLVEEDVAEDIERLHFASAPLADGQFAVAMVRRELLDALEASLPEGISVWIPEQLLLPWQAGDCTLLIEDDRVLLRWGQTSGTAVPLEMLPLLAAALPNGIERWVIYGDAIEALTPALPAAAVIDHRRGHFADALMLVDIAKSPINLRQGDYAPKLPLARWWQLWRPAAIAAGIAVVLQLGVDVAHWQRLKTENLALREAIQASYRQANPRGAVVDVEKQLDRQLAGLRRSDGGGKPFTPMLATVLKAVTEVGDIALGTLNYSTSGELRINMTAPDFAAVEALRDVLSGAGVTVSLEGTSARGDRISARLVVAQS